MGEPGVKGSLKSMLPEILKKTGITPACFVFGFLLLGIPIAPAAFTIQMIKSLDSVYQIDLKNSNGEVEQYQCVGFRERNSSQRMNLFFNRNDLSNRTIINLANYISASVRKIPLSSDLESISNRTYPNSQMVANNLQFQKQNQKRLLDISTTMQANYITGNTYTNGLLDEGMPVNHSISKSYDAVALVSSNNDVDNPVNAMEIVHDIEGINDLQRLEIISHTILKKIEIMSERAKTQKDHGELMERNHNEPDVEQKEKEIIDAENKREHEDMMDVIDDQKETILQVNEMREAVLVEQNDEKPELVEDTNNFEEPIQEQNLVAAALPNHKPGYSWEQAVVVDWEKYMVSRTDFSPSPAVAPKTSKSSVPSFTPVYKTNQNAMDDKKKWKLSPRTSEIYYLKVNQGM